MIIPDEKKIKQQQQQWKTKANEWMNIKPQTNQSINQLMNDPIIECGNNYNNDNNK